MEYKTLFFENVLNNLIEGICIYDDKGKFLFVNNAVLKSSGRARKDYLDQTVYGFYELGIIDKCIVDDVYKIKKQVTMIQTSIALDGKQFKKLVTVSPIFDSDGKVAFAVSVLREMDVLNEMFNHAKMQNSISSVNHKISNDHIKNKIICESVAMKNIIITAKNVSDIDSAILLCGDSGTGKEVIAHYIHDSGKRGSKEMIEINCASLPETLLEAELFGYEKGSFTGALPGGKTGLVESADNSTLFLDEINSMPLSLQGKLLRVLETKTITKVGSVKQRHVNFRLIAATNSDLIQCVKKGTFRADLYYRLNVIPITIPPLKERRADIIPLCDYFLKDYCYRYETEKIFSQKIYSTLQKYDWPGNVRELRNFVERMVVMSSPYVVKINKIPDGMLTTENIMYSNDTTRKSLLEQKEKEKIIAALDKNYGHRENTSIYLGISRRTLQYKLKKYNIT